MFVPDVVDEQHGSVRHHGQVRGVQVRQDTHVFDAELLLRWLIQHWAQKQKSQSQKTERTVGNGVYLWARPGVVRRPSSVYIVRWEEAGRSEWCWLRKQRGNGTGWDFNNSRLVILSLGWFCIWYNLTECEPTCMNINSFIKIIQMVMNWRWSVVWTWTHHRDLIRAGRWICITFLQACQTYTWIHALMSCAARSRTHKVFVPPQTVLLLFSNFSIESKHVTFLWTERSRTLSLEGVEVVSKSVDGFSLLQHGQVSKLLHLRFICLPLPHRHHHLQQHPATHQLQFYQ